MAKPVAVEDTLAKLKGYLAIDRNDLDTCLMQQPEVYYRVAEALTQASAARDALKLRFEEETARQDQNIRQHAVRMDEKLTETAVQQKLRLLPVIQELQQDLLEKRSEVENLTALKESFQQRSFMLRELVALVIAQGRDLALEGGANQARTALAERNRAEAGAIRRRRFEGS